MFALREVEMDRDPTLVRELFRPAKHLLRDGVARVRGEVYSSMALSQFLVCSAVRPFCHAL